MRQQVLVPWGQWVLQVPAYSLLVALPGELCPALGQGLASQRGHSPTLCVRDQSFALESWMLLANVDTTSECVTRQCPTDGTACIPWHC